MYLVVNLTLFLKKEKIDPGLNFKVLIFFKGFTFLKCLFFKFKVFLKVFSVFKCWFLGFVCFKKRMLQKPQFTTLLNKKQLNSSLFFIGII